MIVDLYILEWLRRRWHCGEWVHPGLYPKFQISSTCKSDRYVHITNQNNTNVTATFTTIHILILIHILMGEFKKASWPRITYSGTGTQAVPTASRWPNAAWQCTGPAAPCRTWTASASSPSTSSTKRRGPQDLMMMHCLGRKIRGFYTVFGLRKHLISKPLIWISESNMQHQHQWKLLFQLILV